MIPRRFITMRNCRRTRKRNNLPLEALYEKTDTVQVLRCTVSVFYDLRES